MKNKKLASMFMMILMITLPIAYAQVINTNFGDQARNIGDELERRVTTSPTVSDIIGEDIIINVKEYQPAILRTGILEDQGAVVYAILSGTPSNPAITIPKIHDVDILSYNVVTVPEGLPVRIGKPRYFRDRTQTLTYDNMGYLQIPIARIAKESNVPDELIIEVEARVLFDVSSGLGKSPTKMVIREKTSETKVDNQRYLNIYIEAEEISSNYAILDIFDSNGNLIEDDLRIDKGVKSKTIRRNRFYSPGQVFDKFNIYLKDIKSGGRTIDIMVLRDGVPETHTVSEGESIYPGSGITLERIEIRGDKIHADFRTPSGRLQTAGFPKSFPTAAGEIKYDKLEVAKNQDKTEGADPIIICGDKKTGAELTSTINNAYSTLRSANTPEEYSNVLTKLNSCTDLFQSNPTFIPQEHAIALQSILAQVESDTTDKLTTSNQFEDVHTLAQAKLNAFLTKYWEVYSSATFSLGAISGDSSVKEIYGLAADEFSEVVSLVDGEIEVEYEQSASKKTTKIPEFYAQYNKAVINHAKLKDLGQAVIDYNKLLEMSIAYTTSHKEEADALILPGRIQSRINLLTAFIKDPSGRSVRAEIDIKETNGEIVTIVLDGSSLTDYKLEESTSFARVKIFGTDGRASENSHELHEGDSLPLMDGAEPWIIEKITSSSILIKTASKPKPLTVPRDDRNGIDVPIKIGEIFKTQKVVLETVELHNAAHIIVSPNIEKAFSAARFNLHIPIEKRALDLPLFSDSIESEIDKTERLLESLDRTLEKVGKIHEAWKKFCFGVYTSIAAWNFLKSAVGSGAGRAKDSASETFWEQHGEDCTRRGFSMDECVFENEASYNKILNDAEKAYDYADKKTYTGELADIKKTDENKVQLEELAYLQKRMEQDPSDKNTQDYLNAYVQVKGDQNYQEELGKSSEGELSDKERADLKVRVANRNAEMFKGLKSSYSSQETHLTSLDLAESSIRLPDDNKVFVGDLAEFEKLTPELRDQTRERWITRRSGELRLENTDLTSEQAKEKALVEIDVAFAKTNTVYPSPNGGLIFFPSNAAGAKSLLSPDGKEYVLSSTSTGERFEHKPRVTYYTEGPNAGKIHRMTIDAVHYAEIDYTSGGRMMEPRIFERTNPNEEIRADDTEFGGEGINDVTKKWNEDGHDTSNLKKVESCVGTINRAKASNRESVICNGIDYAIRNDPVTKGVSCVEFYSPTECKLLFNACDPVLCPSSRFDLGGTWHVDNVAETGIIGSSILGLHNFGIPGTDIGFDGGQVVMPICITGIYAGLQNIRTVLMEYSDCLKRSLVDDESVGICDMLRSYYICDVLWKEAMAIFNIKSGIVGTVLNKIHDNEGSEYTDFDASMDQSINGLKYFTQDYAKNTFAQFSGGALPEIGAEVCKAAVYGKVPGVGSFTDRLLQPESPPQFTATMDVVPYSDIPFPPQATYKVYYRMYAGANEPVSFSVYLKNQNIDGQSGLPIAWLVRNKRLTPDAFDAENIDFTAPEGYNQVCVAYSSPTYGVREECGFGKTSSGFAIDYVAQRMAKKEAGQGGIQTAEQCNPSGSSLSGPYNSYGTKAAAVAVGGFSSGILETGINRVCSTFTPGDEADWKAVGECWEGPKPNEGRNLGYCWLHLPSAKNIVTEYSVNKEIDWNNLEETLPNATQGTIDRIDEYVQKLGLRSVYLTSEDLDEAEERIATALNKKTDEGVIKKEGFEEAVGIYRDVINHGVLETFQKIEFRLKLAHMYGQWARDTTKKLYAKNNPPTTNTGQNQYQIELEEPENQDMPDTRLNNYISAENNFLDTVMILNEDIGVETNKDIIGFHLENIVISARKLSFEGGDLTDRFSTEDINELQSNLDLIIGNANEGITLIEYMNDEETYSWLLDLIDLIFSGQEYVNFFLDKKSVDTVEPIPEIQVNLEDTWSNLQVGYVIALDASPLKTLEIVGIREDNRINFNAVDENRGSVSFSNKKYDKLSDQGYSIISTISPSGIIFMEDLKEGDVLMGTRDYAKIKFQTFYVVNKINAYPQNGFNNYDILEQGSHFKSVSALKTTYGDDKLSDNDFAFRGRL
jgi:hypothetical protein